MSTRRFFKKEYSYDWWFIFDKHQEYIDQNSAPFETEEGMLIPMSENQVINLINEIYDNLMVYSALFKMLEDYKGEDIENILWTLTGVDSTEEFDKLLQPYVEYAKQRKLI